MADLGGNAEQKLGLSPDERRLYTQVFSAADSEGLGVVTGDVALRFFPEKSKLASEVLGEIWQIADTEDKGFVTPAGFYVILRLIGYAQAGRPVSAELALKPGGPLPRFEGIQLSQPSPAPLQAQGSGPIRVPPLPPDEAHRYAALFDSSGAVDGALPGQTAKQIFDRARVPNPVLAQIWNLADTEQRGQLSATEFIIAMHLLASYRAGALQAMPNNLPAGLYEAAARRGAPPPRPVSGSRPGSEMYSASAVPRQMSGAGAPRTSSPLARQQYPAPPPGPAAAGAWAVSPQEKTQFDSQFAALDTSNQGYVTGEQAVEYFSRSRLPEDDLASIWDLADITQTGQLNRDEFAVAMFLIRQQLSRKGPLPTALPPSLIPPSMRRPGSSAQTRQPLAAATPPKPKSAADDLFGLDAAAPPAPQVPQSTGGSSAFTPAASEQAASHPQSTQSSTMFKPFVPTSSFGQSIVTPQATGARDDAKPSPQEQPAQRGGDDLLGDTDPEVNKRLTNETTELANLSNQVGTLSNQMKEVQLKRGATGQNLSQATSQKKEFETRLAQLRSAYEQEAREVRTLEERLAEARKETQKVQQDLAMVDHSYQNLQEQKLQMQAALEADQKENAILKERMRVVNAESNQLKAQLEKIRSEARQQKGLVAINKKQLSTNETDRDKHRADLDKVTGEYNDSTRELEDSKRALDNAPSALSRASTVASPAAASPAPSTASMNPFFRRASTTQGERGLSQSSTASQATASPNYNAFDSIFGAPAANNAGASAPPPTTFQRAPSASSAASATQNVALASQSAVDRPSTSQSDLSSEANAPPPPPHSRQITSSLLPLKDQISRAASPSSSVGVAPPASRFGDVSDVGTEPEQEPQASKHEQSPLSRMTSAGATTTSNADSEELPTPQASAFELAPSAAAPGSAPLSAAQPIPGAFPGDPTPLTTPQTESYEAAAAKSPSGSDPFAAGASPDPGPSGSNEFDDAFASLNSEKEGAKGSKTGDVAPNAARREFPPIQEFGGDEDSDSDSDGEAPQAKTTQQSTTSAPGETSILSRGLAGGTGVDPQQSTLSRQETMGSTIEGRERGDSNVLAAEYSDLLPSRQKPSSTHESDHSNANGSAGNAHFASNDPKGKAPVRSHDGNPKTLTKESGFDDFDTEFADLKDAQAADDRGDESTDFGGGQSRDGFEEFNPTFDSPAPSKATTQTEGTPHPFHDFESSLSQSGTSLPAKQPAQHSSDDWDAMFAGLDSAGSGKTNGKSDFDSAFDSAFGPALAPPTDQTAKPGLARAISVGTEHDDPILKRLTSMGYPREQSLQALEKFDYNLDKAADYLTSKG